jgi:hypothetical protein
MNLYAGDPLLAGQSSKTESPHCREVMILIRLQHIFRFTRSM